MEDPAEARKRGAKAVVRRDVVRVVTPGTLTEDTLLDARRHNYLAALAEAGGDARPRLARSSPPASSRCSRPRLPGSARRSRGSTRASCWCRNGCSTAAELIRAVRRLEGRLTPLPNSALRQRERPQRRLESLYGVEGARRLRRVRPGRDRGGRRAGRLCRADAEGPAAAAQSAARRWPSAAHGDRRRRRGATSN